MKEDDFDIPQSKMADSAERVVDRALEEARRREHALLTNEHVCLAFAQAEWDMFGDVMRDLELNPHEILQALEEHLRLLPSVPGRELRVAPSTKLLFKLALLHASRCGRHTIEATDLFSAIFEETQGIPVSIIRRHGIEPDALVTRLATRMRDHELREERLKKRFELPPFLKHFATNLNQLARQDKLPPVFGRDAEMDRVLEVLCHRERANSVLLLGEPGVGKTAIAEGIARRIEFEPETVPIRLRDCQVVNLQMNTMVAGTMLRGMFEDRIQNVIREIKERPNLILFIDEVHTMIGAGSALGAPSDAANVFKSVLARGEVRIIGATTQSEYKEFIQEDEALARRFRTVHVAEPTIEETRTILYHLRPRLERNYSVRITDEAIETALQMSPRYMRHLQMPDKVIGWLDTAAVRAEIDRRWDVGSQDVVRVISRVARIPEDMVFREVTDRFRDMETRIGARVVGQRKAIDAVVRRLVLNKGPLKDGFDRPDGVLLFLGPTGVGKTELAKIRGALPLRRREEDDPRRHVRVPGRGGRGRQTDRHAARDRRIGARRRADEPAEGPSVLGRAARRSREGEPEHAQPVPPGVRRRLGDRRPRQTRLSERRDRHHDLEHRLRALPQAHQSARLLLEAGRHRAGGRRRPARARAAVLARVPQPDRRSRDLLAALEGRSPRRSRSSRSRRSSGR